MVKIGRNDMCPCGSGRKYKRCCLDNAQPAPQTASQVQQQQQPSLRQEIGRIQQDAVDKKESVREFGVFILFSTREGDAWLLEMIQSDALLVAAGGSRLEYELEENPKTIEINWTHTFSIRNKKFVSRTYKDKIEEIHPSYPAHSISAAIKRIRKKFPKEMLDTVHLDEAEVK